MTNGRVLLIDDDDASRVAVSMLLSRSGFFVHALDSPIGATRAIRDHHINLVVCDFHMPAMRGDAFARMFRQSRVLRELPLIVISAAPPEELDQLRGEGTVDAIVHKGELSASLVPLLMKLRNGS